MWIVLGILLFLAVLITVILMLPIDIIIKNDEDDNLILLYKFLFKTYGEDPDPNNILVKTIKETSGLSRIEKGNLEKRIEQSGFAFTVSETCRILMNLIKEIAVILKYCKLKKFQMNIVCAGDDAAEAAMEYGKCCAAVYPIAAFFGSVMKCRKKVWDININCNFANDKKTFRYDFLVRISLFRAIIALFKTAYKEARRRIEQENSTTAPNHKS